MAANSGERLMFTIQVTYHKLLLGSQESASLGAWARFWRTATSVGASWMEGSWSAGIVCMFNFLTCINLYKPVRTCTVR